jgi:hypothetical protein
LAAMSLAIASVFAPGALAIAVSSQNPIISFHGNTLATAAPANTTSTRTLVEEMAFAIHPPKAKPDLAMVPAVGRVKI